MRLLYFYSQSTKLFMYFGKVQILIYIVGKTILVSFRSKHVKSLSRKMLRFSKKCFQSRNCLENNTLVLLNEQDVDWAFQQKSINMISKLELISLDFFLYQIVHIYYRNS